jgi:hypothetical protein
MSLTGHGVADWFSGFSGILVISVSGSVSQVVNRERVLVAIHESNGPLRIQAHCSGIRFVKQRTTCILQEDKLRAVSYVLSAYIHKDRVIPSHSS